MKHFFLILAAVCAILMSNQTSSIANAANIMTTKSSNELKVTLTELLGSNAKAVQALVSGKNEESKNLRKFVKSMLMNRLNAKPEKMRVSFEKETNSLVIVNNTEYNNADLKKRLIENTAKFAKRLLELKQTGMDNTTMMNQLKMEFSK